MASISVVEIDAVSAAQWKSTKNRIMKCYSETGVCHAVSHGWAHASSESADMIVMAQSDDDLIGFITCKFQKSNIYITLICSRPGMGRRMLRVLTTWAATHDFETLSLHSIVSTITFYRKLGFENAIAPDHELPEITALADKCMHMRVTSTTVERNPTFVAFLQSLIKNKLTQDRCKTITTCIANGFSMVYHVNHSENAEESKSNEDDDMESIYGVQEENDLTQKTPAVMNHVMDFTDSQDWMLARFEIPQNLLAKSLKRVRNTSKKRK
jgi:hypothetical protein